MTKICFLLILFIFLILGNSAANPANSRNSTNSFHKNDETNSKGTVNVNNNVTEIDEIGDEGWEYENTTVVDTRRILFSKTVAPGKRPYMVYLQLTKESAKAHKYRGWLCGGVIVDRYYVLTSAACVEDADRFYIVSGTTKFVDSFDYKDDECVCKHRRKVVWKCVPKNYKFDFQDSIKWSSNDIAIVKVDRPFKLGVCEKGCEFPTDLICYNNISRELEKPGTKGFIAGWGSGSNFREGVYRRQHITQNARSLQEAKVCIMDNEQCAKKWAQRFRNIITQYMICTKDVMKRLSEVCDKRYANCTDMDRRRHVEDDQTALSNVRVDLGRHLRDPDDYTARRSSLQGGFCENDHGGPMIVKYQGKERVIGVISACKIDPKSHSCHGPFLYTSIFKNRQFISCSIHKDVEENCRRVFRTGITHEEWTVDWDGVDEDQDKAESKEDTKNEDEDSSGESGDSKETLRDGKKEKEKKIVEETAEDKEEEVTKPSKSEKIKHEKKEKTKVPKSSGKHKKSKRNKPKPHEKSASKKKEDKSEAKESKGSSSEENRRRNKKREASYESSSDENVNDPSSE